MKKKLKKNEYKLLRTELAYQRDEGRITTAQLQEMMGVYEVSPGINFIRTLVTIGAILIGLGILSFVASNWKYMGKLVKVMMILATLGTSIFTSFRLEEGYPKTSKALLYLSGFIYGAGIFLIGQVFNYGGEFTSAFLLWAIGISMMGWIMKDEILFILAHGLFLVYLNGSFHENVMLYALIFTIGFYRGNKEFGFSKMVTFFNHLVGLNVILYVLHYLDVHPSYTVIIFFLIGCSMYYIKHNLNRDIVKFQGILVLGTSGIVLTFKGLWEELSYIQDGSSIAVIFGIGLLIYLLYLVQKGLLTPLIFTCILILRYYFDTLYDFMPKSLFFIFGGLILLGFGHYFERLRKERGGI
ncbi:DUF2157 domain-containing protein [Clostridiaceae bacterium 35-E11]